MVEGRLKSLDASDARWICPPDSFRMEADPVPEELQQRAVSALRFGVGAGQGFHMVAVGSNQVAMDRYLAWLLGSTIRDLPPCCDWCYVMNFKDANAPQAIRLPTGMGREFQHDLQAAISDLRIDLPRTFETEAYEERRNQLVHSLERQRDDALQTLQQRAEQLGFSLVKSQSGFVVAPMVEGRALNPQEFAQLEPEQRKPFEAAQDELSNDMDQVMRQVRAIDVEARQTIQKLDAQIADDVVQQGLSQLEQRYAEYERIVTYLEQLQDDIVEHVNVFRQAGGNQDEPGVSVTPQHTAVNEFFRRYHVNLIVDHAEDSDPILLAEDNPTYGNLIGKIERRGVMGTLVTDFTMIKPGALLKANEGFLVLDLRDVLHSEVAWEALKTALEQRVVRIEEIGQVLGTIATTALEPEPILLDIKIILTGDARLVNTLAASDPDFNRLFKIRAEFHSSADRSPELTQALASFLAALRDGTRPVLDPTGIARLLEHAARLAGDQRRLSVELAELEDIAREAMQIASSHHNQRVSAENVKAAIDQRQYRARYAAERTRQMLLDRMILVDTQGTKIGQVNGLTVMSASSFAFGTPVRITARTFAGRGGIVDIEREVELGGPIHSKGVFILNGYLGGKYGREKQLSLAASLVFEQSYAPVEGDSASLGELCSLLSSLAELPVDQSLAVTGSVNQHGEVQPIGGLNEKVEGYFDLCEARGLTGSQGVIFPHSNIVNLMLRDDVLKAINMSQFHLYPVNTVDEAIELFTGLAAGEQNASGKFPERSVHCLVASRLATFAAATRRGEAS